MPAAPVGDHAPERGMSGSQGGLRPGPSDGQGQPEDQGEPTRVSQWGPEIRSRSIFRLFAA
jgi:hypothetical protein